MAHTPGPWETRESPRNNDVWYVEGPSEPNGKWLVAEANGRNQTNEANARLIAAAPDLLEACKSARDRMWASRSPTSVVIANQCDRAIANAEGRTEDGPSAL